MRELSSFSGGFARTRGALANLIIFGSMLCWSCRADTIARTGFEEPGSLGDISGTFQQMAFLGAITNEAGLQNVQYATGSVAPGAELGFATTWATNAVSALDGLGPVTSSGDTLDLIGVTDLAPPGTNFVGGSFGYMMEDADGEIVLSFDPVDLSGYVQETISLNVFLSSTTWEAGDYLRISVAGSMTNLVVFDTTGFDIDDLAIEGTWNQLDASLEGFDVAALQIAFSSNAGEERLWIDDVVFSGIVIPEPSSAILLCMGACLLCALSHGRFTRFARRADRPEGHGD